MGFQCVFPFLSPEQQQQQQQQQQRRLCPFSWPSSPSGKKGICFSSGFGIFRFGPRGGGRKRKHRDLFAPHSSSSCCCCSPLFAVAGPERVVLFPAARLERARAAREAAQEGRCVGFCEGTGRARQRCVEGSASASRGAKKKKKKKKRMLVTRPIPISHRGGQRTRLVLPAWREMATERARQRSWLLLLLSMGSKQKEKTPSKTKGSKKKKK